jgi:hypothetical protein
MRSFQLIGLPFEPFAALFTLGDDALAAVNAQRVVAAEKPGYPCRVSLVDADVGEELLLLPYVHQPENSPYHSSGPIFVRRGATSARLEPGFVPDAVRRRLISVRAYDSAHLMIEATVCDGNDTAREIMSMLTRDEVAYIHLHNAKRGCFSCTALPMASA